MNCSWPLLFIQVRFHLLQLQGICEISVFQSTQGGYTKSHRLSFSRKKWWERSHHRTLVNDSGSHSYTFLLIETMGKWLSPFIFQSCMLSEWKIQACFSTSPGPPTTHSPTSDSTCYSSLSLYVGSHHDLQWVMRSIESVRICIWERWSRRGKAREY